MKTYAFIYNPTAGAGKTQQTYLKLKKEIKKRKNCELFCSVSKGDISDFIDKRFDDFDVFVACGGDGTIREIAPKLLYSSKKMGIIPMGTGNDLCKTLKIPRNFEKAFTLVIEGKSRKIDVGSCNDFIFLNALGFGFDGLTNRYSTRLKHLHPFLCYTISAIKAIFTHEPFPVTITAGVTNINRSVIMISFANGRVEGGCFWIAPEASLTDGKLNCVSIAPIKKWTIPFLLPLFLLKKPQFIPKVNSELIENIRLEIPQKVDIHADGEVINTETDIYDIQLMPKALEVACKT